MRTSLTGSLGGGGRIGRSLLAASMSVAAIAASVTGAYFTDSEASTGNQFATGNVDIAVSPTSAIVTQTNMAPGDAQTGAVVVSNSGSLEMRYALASTTTEDTLAAQLDLTVWAEAAETTVDGTCDATAPATTLYGAADLGAVAGVNLVGDPAQGTQAGDRVLAAAATETLCFRVELPSSTGNAFESLDTTATFTFTAEQTANLA